MRPMSRVLLLLALAALTFGCARPKEETVPVTNNDPMLQVKATLQNYAKGQPLASEVSSFDYMIEEVRKTSPEKADVVKAGLDDLKTTKGSPAAKAKALLQKLGLDK
jgi:hypothetical protein